MTTSLLAVNSASEVPMRLMATALIIPIIISADITSIRVKPRFSMIIFHPSIYQKGIADTTGYESATIQSLIVKHEKLDTFPYSVILIDEASMINSSLFARFLVKVSKKAILIIVGDDAQFR